MKKPSVTELTKILDKPALLNWANKQGLLGIDISIARKKWLNDGTSIHSQIENFIKNGVPFLESSTQFMFENFFKDKSIEFVEKQIETDWFTGRIDIGLLYNNCFYICDFKSNQKNVYIENKLQLVAYGMAERCEKYAIISVPDFTLIPVEIPDTKPYEEILKALSIIYTNKELVKWQ